MRFANGKLCAGLCVLFALVTLAYSNHFENSFHFDDSHTIVDNPYIRDLHHIGLIFSDTRTSSTLPANRMYRPLVTASLAVDYWIAHGLKPLYFHASTFLWFITQLFLMFVLFRKICDLANPHPRNPWVALCAAGIYGIHPAIAETVNYVIQRADIYSTLGVVAAIAAYAIFPGSRKSGWYLVPLILAILSKPPALIFPAILFVYVRLFEEDRTVAALVRCIPALLVTALMGFIVTALTPATFDPTSGSAFAYRITQPLVALRYFKTFFIPSGLTADTDFAAVASVFEGGAWLGFAFVAAVLALAVWCSIRREWKPAGFGLWWFLLAQVPTAGFALAEVENDHRMYFPFVGLALACCWAIALWSSRIRTLRPAWRAIAVSAVVLAVLSLVAATRKRNEVWRTEESLWLDVTQKSPKNGRGLMNYGLTQMAKGDYRKAMDYFNRAAVYTPAYFSLEINRGIASGGLNENSAAEGYFHRAIALKPNAAESYFFYGRWLKEGKRFPEAITQLEQAVAKNADYMPARYLLMQTYSELGDWVALRAAADNTLQRFPEDGTAAAFLASAESAKSPRTAEDYLNLSLAHHRAGRYEECIAAAREALKLRPNYAEAYNNIAAAYEELQMWDLAIAAASEAIRIRPDFTLARNNLAWAQSQKKIRDAKKGRP